MDVYRPRQRRKDRPATLGATLDAYIRELTAQGKPSARNVRIYAARTLGLGIFGERSNHRCFAASMPITDLDEEAIHQLKVARRDEGLSAQSIIHELASLRAALRLAERRGFAVPKVSWDLKPSKPKTRWFSFEEFELLWLELDPERPVFGNRREDGSSSPPSEQIIVARQKARDLLLMLALTGGRMGEVLDLTLDQVGPDGLRLFGSKTNQERYVPCTPQVMEAVARRVEAARAAGTIYLFPSRQRPGETVKRPRLADATMIRKAIDRAGLNPPHLVKRHGTATIHTLRHTFASWLLQSGEPLGIIQPLLGHASDRSTARYAHLASGAAVAAATARLTVVANRLRLPENS